MIYVGIDPGITGSVATLDDSNRCIEFYDTPTVTTKVGKKFKNQMDAPAIVLLLEGITSGHEVIVTIEKVNAMPGWKSDPDNPGQRVQASMGVTSAFNFGCGYGIWLGILSALKLPFQQVHPLTWKRSMMMDMGREKDASRVKAMQLFPHTAGDLKLKKHHGRADALLMAAWAMKVGSRIATPQPFDVPEPSLF